MAVTRSSGPNSARCPPILTWTVLARKKSRGTWRGRGAGGLSRATGGLALAAGLCLAALAVSLFTAEWGLPGVQTEGPAYHRTLEGERLTVSLPDRSEVSLAPLGVMAVTYSEGARNVRLERGLAYFSVAADAGRPFIVTAGERVITVTGTEFQVSLSGDWPEVVLAEGAVEVSTRGDAEAPVHRLNPGERLAGPGRNPDIDPVDVDTETAWRSGQLVFRDTPLGEVAAAFNRHAHEPIEVVGEAARTVRISGVFRHQQVHDFVAALEDTFEVSAERRPEGGYVIRAREDSR
jgi:transmembrane sensor